MKKNGRSNIRHMLAAVLFCMVLGTGITCIADEGTVTVESAKVRASADTSSEQVESALKGDNVEILGETTGADGKLWYEVSVNGTRGYIRADLVQKSGASSNTSSSEQTPTTATPVEARRAVVTTNKASIRTGAGTNYDKVGTANQGTVLTVTGEANGSDGYKWYQVSFTYDNSEKTGFIRSDLVSFDNVPEDTAVSEITGEGATEPETQEPEPEPETQEPEQSNNESQGIILMNVEETPYIMPGFVAVDLNWNDQKINAYKNGNFYIFYAMQQNGEEGWFLFDSEKGLYQRYVYTSSDVTVPDESSGTVGIIPVIILVIVIIILVAIVGLLFLKLHAYKSYDDYGDEDDEDYGDEDDMEELEDFEEERRRQPARRPQGQGGSAPQGQPARRPQGQGGSAPQGQPARRPQGQGSAASQGQPARRPQGQGTSASQGQPVRRPQNQNESQPARRPQPQGGEGTGRPQSQRQSGAEGRQPQNARPAKRPASNPGAAGGAQPQTGRKGKPVMENDEDDMDFMDI